MNRLLPALLSLSMVLAACATPDVPPPPLPVARPGAESVNVSAANSGAAVTLERGQALIVSLVVDATAAPEWSLVDAAPGVLTVTSSKFERAQRVINIEESGGSMVWHFKPQAAGAATLRFELRRPRSLQPARQVVVYNVTVK